MNQTIEANSVKLVDAINAGNEAEAAQYLEAIMQAKVQDKIRETLASSDAE